MAKDKIELSIGGTDLDKTIQELLNRRVQEKAEDFVKTAVNSIFDEKFKAMIEERVEKYLDKAWRDKDGKLDEYVDDKIKEYVRTYAKEAVWAKTSDREYKKAVEKYAEDVVADSIKQHGGSIEAYTQLLFVESINKLVRHNIKKLLSNPEEVFKDKEETGNEKQ